MADTTLPQTLTDTSNDGDAGHGGTIEPLHRARLASQRSTAPTQGGQGEIPGSGASDASADGVERIIEHPTLGWEGRTSLLRILRGIRDGQEPLGPLELVTPGEAEPSGPPAKRGKTRKGATNANSSVPASDDQGAERRDWPSGPLIGRELFSPDEVRRIVEGILTDEEIMAHPTMPGLTRARLREVARRLGFELNRFGRFSAALLIWFADAGVTVLADDKAKTEWSRPRPLIGNSRAEIRRRLWATDAPDGVSAAAIARSAGFNSSSL